MDLRQQSTGQLIQLHTSAVLGAGGEATVYAVSSQPSVAAKVYHRHSPERAAKLIEMLANPPQETNRDAQHRSIAWPIDLLTALDSTSTIVGFLMRRVSGFASIFDYYNPKTRRRVAPLFHYGYLLRTGRNLASAFDALHGRGYVVGDVNESNILVSAAALTTIIDVDSFQVTNSETGKVFRCGVGKPEYTPPELQGHSFADRDRSPEHDAFGFAVLMFQLLMEGSHPFNGRYLAGGESPTTEERIRNGHFPYGSRPVPYAAPMPELFSAMPRTLQSLFIRCFELGHSRPNTRPRPKEWRIAFAEVEGQLCVCGANAQHVFSTHNAGCPWCARHAISSRDPFPSQAEVSSRLHLRRPAVRSAASSSSTNVGRSASGHTQQWLQPLLPAASAGAAKFYQSPARNPPRTVGPTATPTATPTASPIPAAPTQISIALLAGGLALGLLILSGMWKIGSGSNTSAVGQDPQSLLDCSGCQLEGRNKVYFEQQFNGTVRNDGQGDFGERTNKTPVRPAGSTRACAELSMPRASNQYTCAYRLKDGRQYVVGFPNEHSSRPIKIMFREDTIELPSTRVTPKSAQQALSCSRIDQCAFVAEVFAGEQAFRDSFHSAIAAAGIQAPAWLTNGTPLRPVVFRGRQMLIGSSCEINNCSQSFWFFYDVAQRRTAGMYIPSLNHVVWFGTHSVEERALIEDFRMPDRHNIENAASYPVVVN